MKIVENDIDVEYKFLIVFCQKLILHREKEPEIRYLKFFQISLLIINV